MRNAAINEGAIPAQQPVVVLPPEGDVSRQAGDAVVPSLFMGKGNFQREADSWYEGKRLRY